ERHLSLEEMRRRHPEFIIEHAVKGMLPKNRLAARMITKLKVYAGAEHPHAAQNPQPLSA
ncbi:MAG: uL13 family ribosomal protein, partial [Opitutaceae bacterium]|nr:uL13 family ribosomal protein [Opitutaceae bacterium]